MRIALSTDHAGFEALRKLQAHLENKGYECVNFGPEAYQPNDDYPDYIRPAAEAVARGEFDFGIIFGGSGEGEAMVANRVKGIRCGVYYGPEKAKQPINSEGDQAADEYEILRLNRSHNNANMLSLAGRFLDQEDTEKAVSIWLETPFSGEERHVRRNAKLDEEGKETVICPTVLARDESDFAAQIKRVSPFAKRIQIDLMDGEFASPASVSLDKIWWPPHLTVDIHLMYQRPMEHLEQLLKLKPHMVIFHVEAMFHHMHMAAELHKEGIRAGLAILPETPVKNIEQILNSFDHLLIFSGHLGSFGGQADAGLLQKVPEAKLHHPDLEIGWDGGVNDQNARELSEGGIDVLNAGGFIQNSQDPSAAYNTLVESVA